MTGLTHVIVGASTGWMVTKDALGAVIGGVAGLLPDIDHPDSDLGARTLGMSTLFNAMWGHRGFAHTVPALFLYAALGYGITNLFKVPAHMPELVARIVFVGALSHVVLDCLNPEGIKLLWPITNYRIRGPIPTGSLTEYLLISVPLTAIWLMRWFKHMAIVGGKT